MKFQFTNDTFQGEMPSGTLAIAKDDINGFRPYQLLIASIASCSGFVFQQIYEKQRLEVDEFYITSSLVRNEKEANRVEEIYLTFHLAGKDLNEKKLQRNLEMTHKHCGMIQSVKDSIKIHETLELK